MKGGFEQGWKVHKVLAGESETEATTRRCQPVGLKKASYSSHVRQLRVKLRKKLRLVRVRDFIIQPFIS